MKNFSGIFLFVIFCGLMLVVSQCQHDDEIVPVVGPNPDNIVRGTETIDCLTCTPLVSNGASADFNTGAIPANQWFFDKSHSNVEWETPYKGVGSLLTGRFNYFVLEKLVFDEQNPANISFEGYVRLNTVNTGEPGRDNGCLLGTFGTAAGKTNEPENIARLKSTTVAFSQTDAGYIANADMTFNGITLPVTLKLNYVKQTHLDTDGLTVAGIEAQFEFNALTNFKIVSSNISDKITVKLNILLRKKDA